MCKSFNFIFNTAYLKAFLDKEERYGHKEEKNFHRSTTDALKSDTNSPYNRRANNGYVRVDYKLAPFYTMPYTIAKRFSHPRSGEFLR